MNKHYKMICLDIDGTLLNSNHQISMDTKRVIQRVVNEKGTKVVLVSARMPKSIEYIMRELNISTPIICYSGGLVLNESTDGTHQEVLNNVTIPLNYVMEIYQRAKDAGIHCSLYKDDQWFVEEMDDWVRQESKITRIKPKMVNFQELIHLWQNNMTGPNKILCMDLEEKIRAFQDDIQEFHDHNLKIYRSKATYLEIMKKNVSKMAAIELLAKKFDIATKEIVAVGDNFNDIDMIQFAGLGVAMGNAPDEVKKRADEVTSTNDEDGVAKVILRYFF